MSQEISRNRDTRSKINKREMLMKEMQIREDACLSKLKKLSDRINILENFQNQPSAKNVDLKEYLKSKGVDIGRFFSSMGYFTPNNMVVSNDAENDYLTYHKGMNFNKSVGYHIPEREIVNEKDHQEITSSMYGMTWNPALMHYYPTTVFDTDAYASAEGSGDTGMDMIGGLRINDFCRLNNTSEDAKELTSMVQGLLEEEFDNVEGELEIIQDAQNQLYSGNSSFAGEEDTRKVESGKNLVCRSACAGKHPFSKSKREKCQKECDEKFKASQKQEGRREDREDRKEARQEFRADKKDCKAKLKSGEITKSQYRDCVKTERKDKRSDIKDAGGNIFKRGLQTFAKIVPITALARGGVLILVGQNTWGFATRLAPAFLPDEEAKKLFKPEAIEKAKKGWEKVSKGYKNLGGEPDKLKSKAIEGYKKKPYKVARKESFEGGAIYEFEEQSNFAEPLTIIGAVTAGISALTGLVVAFTKAGGEKNPYKEGQTPPDFQESLNDGTVETNPPVDEKAPVLNDKGEWIEKSTGKVIDPSTGKYKDTIFGMNKWVAIGIGVVALAGLYLVLKPKK
jgi:hypothetical protein